MTILHAIELVNNPRNISRDEFWQLCWACLEVPAVSFAKSLHTFREPTDPIRMWVRIRQCSTNEARRRNVTATPSYSTGFEDVRWGVVQAGKKDKEIYIINPYEEWELQK